jgi:hypothetical protein
MGYMQLKRCTFLTLTISFVDRDMVMRYHWGLGVGHTYSHVPGPEISEGYTTSRGNSESPGNIPSHGL